MNRLAETFAQCQKENRKALVMYLCAGDPNLDSSAKIIEAIAKNGADIIEIGVPFSDPMADGPTIQLASQRSLEAGTTLQKIMTMIKRVRQVVDKPFVLFSYYNVIFNYGVEKLAADSATAGIDAWLVVDIPLEEQSEIKPILTNHNLDLIPLLAPTTPLARAKKILKDATGFAYYITVTGVTGTRKELPTDLTQRLCELRKISPVPIVAGFGISSPEMACQSAKHADGIVVGSALVKIINNANSQEEAIQNSITFVKSLNQAIRG